MIAGIFHKGSGLGNQLHRYVAARVLAEDNGYEFGMANQENFKGASFMKLEMGQEPIVMYDHLFRQMTFDRFDEKRVEENGIDIRGYDPEINFVKDHTIIDGEFQDERYFKHRLSEVKRWLRVERLEVPQNVCVIGFRGGEFVGLDYLFLTKDYWEDAIEVMRKIDPKMKFEVHTDDPETAKRFFPGFPIISDIEINWRSMRYARYAIIANSSFYILPRLLAHEDYDDGDQMCARTIAPRYWARRNIGIWALPQNYYSDFEYI